VDADEERHLIRIQCKVLSGSESPKFGSGGGRVTQAPSLLGARPRPRALVPSGQKPMDKVGDHGVGVLAHARARKGGTALTIQPAETGENKM